MPENTSGVNLEEFKSHDIPVRRVRVLTEEAAEQLKKPCGTYTTIMPGPLDQLESLENICNCLAGQLRPHLEPFFGKPLCICGIGNQDTPADSLGPETIRQITPHFYEAAGISSSFQGSRHMSQRTWQNQPFRGNDDSQCGIGDERRLCAYR